MKRIVFCVLATGWLLLFTERPAHAYIDPAAGSLFLQLLLGGVAGLAVVIKMYWRRITSLFVRSDKPDSAA